MDTAQLAEQLVLWIRERVLGKGCEGAVLGMSGGIDSSVVAVLCQRALPQGTLGLIMPCHSNPQDEEHALAVAKKSSIATETVVLDSVFDALLKVLPDDNTNPTGSRLLQANLKARLRMVTLYYFANQRQYMVAGGSNRSELTTGYFTKHGDGGVDILPIGNLVKKQVRELAAFLGIPREIIDKPPSAGLWPGQTDEDDLGFSYDELDRYVLTGEAPDRIREKIRAMVATAGHKRAPPPSPDF